MVCTCGFRRGAQGAFRQAGPEFGGWDESRRELAAPLSDEKLKVHVVPRFRIATRVVRRCLNGGRRARSGHLDSSQAQPKWTTYALQNRTYHVLSTQILGHIDTMSRSP